MDTRDYVMSDQVTPREVVAEAVELAKKKAELGIGDLMIRGMLAGALLGIATSLAFVAVAQGMPPLVGAIIFPVGFVMLVLLGQELATGNFALLPMGLMAGKVRWSGLLS
jgi:formate transporter